MYCWTDSYFLACSCWADPFSLPHACFIVLWWHFIVFHTPFTDFVQSVTFCVFTSLFLVCLHSELPLSNSEVPVQVEGDFWGQILKVSKSPSLVIIKSSNQVFFSIQWKSMAITAWQIQLQYFLINFLGRFKVRCPGTIRYYFLCDVDFSHYNSQSRFRMMILNLTMHMMLLIILILAD